MVGINNQIHKFRLMDKLNNLGNNVDHDFESC